MATPERDRITRLLGEHEDASGGDPSRADADDLLPLVYDELRKLAEIYLNRERSGHTLQPTAVVHEAYLRMVDQTRVGWKGRTHFLAVGAQMMRRLLIDHARGRGRQRRGGNWHRITLDDEVAPIAGQDLDLLAVRDALDKLARLDERQARIVELRFFGGLTVEEVAQVLGVSRRTVEGDWTHARAWLRRELAPGGG